MDLSSVKYGLTSTIERVNLVRQRSVLTRYMRCLGLNRALRSFFSETIMGDHPRDFERRQMQYMIDFPRFSNNPPKFTSYYSF